MLNPDNILNRARQLDGEDPLRELRRAFAGLHENLIYLDGNSLGPLPQRTVGLLEQTVKSDWGDALIRSWNKGWFDLPTRLGDQLATLVGAGKGEVCFADSVTINLIKPAATALKRQGGRSVILTDDLNFPSDYYAIEGLVNMLGNQHTLERVPSMDGMTVPAEDIINAINSETTLVTLSHVVFKSGYLHDLESICAAAKLNGALTLIDLSHSVGSVPIRLGDWGVDMAIGCSYKYLNGGPGAPAFLYVRQDLHEQLEPQLAGWFGCQSPFQFNPHYSPETGIRRFMVGTPPILSLQAIEPGIQLLAGAGMAIIRKKSVKQSELLIELFDEILAPIGFHLGSPRDPAQRGSHLALRHEEAFRINKALIEPPANRPVIIPDFRTPDNLRIGLTPLFLGYEEIVRAALRMQEIVMTGEYKQFTNETETVT